jgi:hypothetical protein
VAKVMPSLVQFDRHGKATGVHYDELPPLLLALAQRDHDTLGSLRRQVRDRAKVNRRLESRLDAQARLLRRLQAQGAGRR